MPKKKVLKEIERLQEIERREDNLTAVYDAKNLVDLEERRPDVISRVKALIEIGYSVKDIGRVIRRDNPQMWVESKFAESVARALLAEEG